MARDQHNSENEQLTNRSTKPPGEHNRIGNERCDASEVADKNAEPDLEMLTQTISECRQLASSARRQSRRRVTLHTMTA